MTLRTAEPAAQSLNSSRQGSTAELLCFAESRRDMNRFSRGGRKRIWHISSSSSTALHSQLQSSSVYSSAWTTLTLFLGWNPGTVHLCREKISLLESCFIFSRNTRANRRRRTDPASWESSVPPFRPNVLCSFLLAVSILHHNDGKGKHYESDFRLTYRCPELAQVVLGSDANVNRCWTKAWQTGSHPLPAGWMWRWR